MTQWVVEIMEEGVIISRAVYKTWEEAVQIKIKLDKIATKTIIIYPIYT